MNNWVKRVAKLSFKDWLAVKIVNLLTRRIRFYAAYSVFVSAQHSIDILDQQANEMDANKPVSFRMLKDMRDSAAGYLRILGWYEANLRGGK